MSCNPPCDCSGNMQLCALMTLAWHMGGRNRGSGWQASADHHLQRCCRLKLSASTSLLMIGDLCICTASRTTSNPLSRGAPDPTSDAIHPRQQPTLECIYALMDSTTMHCLRRCLSTIYKLFARLVLVNNNSSLRFFYTSLFLHFHP